MKQSTLDSITRHVEHGVDPGHFVTAVLENDLKGAFMAADDQNRRDMHEIVAYCFNEIPSPCWGSPEKVKAWRKRINDARVSDEAER